MEKKTENLEENLVNEPIIYEPIIYNLSIIDFSRYKNIILIDKSVINFNNFYTSVNEQTLPIIFSNSSDFNEIDTFVGKNFNFIERLSIVSNDGNINENKIFINLLPYFSLDDFKEEVNEYSPNLKNIINFIKKYKVCNLDFLMCNSLKYENWINYFEEVKTNTCFLYLWLLQ